MTNVKYSCSNLLTFESVVDIDLGIINFMIDKYKKSVYFNQYIVNASSEDVKKNFLLAREDKNPISILLKDKFKASLPDMLKDIADKYLEEVLKFCQPTDILRYAKTLQEYDGVIKCVINCKNSLQEQYIKNLDSTLTTVLNQDNMDGYDCLFLKYVEDVVKYKNLNGKYIFLSNYMHNIDKADGLPKKIILVASDTNKIRTIDPYVGLTLAPITKEEEGE